MVRKHLLVCGDALQIAACPKLTESLMTPQTKVLKNGGMTDNEIVVSKRRRVVAFQDELFSNRHLDHGSTYNISKTSIYFIQL